MSCRNATSPTRSAVGTPVRATPTAVDVTPSMPLAPRLEYTSRSLRGAANHSRSRTGMDDDTTSAPGATRSAAATTEPGSVSENWWSNTSAMANAASASAERQRVDQPSGAGAGPAAARRPHTSATSAVSERASWWSGSGTRPNRSRPTCSAPEVANHWAVTLEATSPPTRSTNSGRSASAHPGWRRTGSKWATTLRCEVRQPEVGSASTGQPSCSARARSASRSWARVPARAPATTTPRRPDTASIRRPSSSSGRFQPGPTVRTAAGSADRGEGGGRSAGVPTSGSRNARFRWTGPGGAPPVRAQASTARSRHHAAPPGSGAPGSQYQRTADP